MIKNVSVIASVAILGALLSGCGNSSNGGASSSSSSSSGSSSSSSGNSSNGGASSSSSSSSGSSSSSSGSSGIDGQGSSSSGSVVIRTPTGDVRVGSDGGTVILRTNDAAGGGDDVAAVVHFELNECTDATTLGSRVACGPKAGVTYVFQSDFAKLGPVDDNPDTPDGGVLLYDAQTSYNGILYSTPNEGNPDEQRIEAVYIPTNYIVLDDNADDDTVDEKYEYMREYLDDVCNMKCMFQEFDNGISSEAFFDENKTEGRFVATYVMQFTRGIAASTLDGEFASGNVDNLEYLAISFEIVVRKNSADSFRFTTPAGTPISFYGKKHGEDAVQVDSTNVVINSIEHAAGLDDADDVITVNMARYFDKLIAKGDSIAISDYAKEILVENALNPWPVKIYGTLHEIQGAGLTSFDRSFVRNPAKLDANLFNLNVTGPYKNAFNSDVGQKANAQKFILVYPGGVYNQL